MNVSPRPDQLLPAAPRASLVRRVADVLLGKVVTLLLACVALVLGVGTFVLLSGGVSLEVRPSALFVLILWTRPQGLFGKA